MFFEFIITETVWFLNTKGAVLVFELFIIEFLEIIFEATKFLGILLNGFE
jgi:hypothetical protein